MVMAQPKRKAQQVWAQGKAQRLEAGAALLCADTIHHA